MTDRKSATSLTTAEQTRFKNGITALLANPSNPYGKLVAAHVDMSHNQHGMNAIGTQRFLPWHRVFLLRLEELLKSVDPASSIPYWDWTTTRSVPAWIRTFKPTVFVPGSGSVVVKRNASIPATKSVTSILALSTYTTFTDTLENGPHGEIHMEVGVVSGVREAMARITVSPADPIFWLHHAQIDRLWSEWQVAHPGKNPTLSGVNATMDPWAEKESQVRSITALNYRYV